MPEICNTIPEDHKLITKVSIIERSKVFYPLRFAIQKRDIIFNEALALTIIPLPDDVNYPASTKSNDAGQLWDYRVQVTTNNQNPVTSAELFRFLNKKVIVVLHHNAGRIILGCNEMPLQFSYSDDNTSNPASTSGFTVECTGNSIIPKVLR
ncbi:hypothetical protein [Flavobacterium beibuense]|uniref:hypothetical protein n=1 Tax=Flavobacterium beibuense TaxID=657326 RepID=UPI003A9245BA